MHGGSFETRRKVKKLSVAKWLVQRLLSDKFREGDRIHCEAALSLTADI